MKSLTDCCQGLVADEFPETPVYFEGAIGYTGKRDLVYKKQEIIPENRRMKKILIIEDDMDLQEGLSFSLGAEGYTIETSGTICHARQKMSETMFDGVILDCNLPDGSGFDLCQEIRKQSLLPILMLTARDTELDEVKALELGVDDFMSKPFSVAVLKARLKKLLLRGEEETFLNSNGICLDKRECRVFQDGKEISLSKIEYKLLLYFMENKNKVLSKEQILERIWDNEGRFVDDNTVSVNVRRLRQKIEENPAEPVYIKTVYGLGYLWKETGVMKR